LSLYAGRFTAFGGFFATSSFTHGAAWVRSTSGSAMTAPLLSGCLVLFSQRRKLLIGVNQVHLEDTIVPGVWMQPDLGPAIAASRDQATKPL
jgi:hypothetical protein